MGDDKVVAAGSLEGALAGGAQKEPAASATASVADEWRAGPLSRLTWGWMFPLIKLGYSRPLAEADIGNNVDRDVVRGHLATFEANMRCGDAATIRRTIWKTFSRNELHACALKFLSDLASYVPPLCVAYVVEYAQDASSSSDLRIFLVASAMLLAPLTVGLCNHWWYHLVMLDGLHARTAIQAAVFSKALRLSNAARTRSSADGGVSDTMINLQSTDCRSVEVCYWMWIYAWAAPLQVVVTTVLMYMQLGWCVFLGIAVLALMGPAQKRLMKSLKTLMKAASEASDGRIKLISEIVHGVQVVKMQAWEDIFAEKVRGARVQELKQRRRIAFLQAGNTALTECTSILAMVVTFGAYGLFESEPLTAAKAFTTLALFSILRTPMSILPMLIGMVAGGTVAAKRLGAFLYSDEIETYVQVGQAAAKPHEDAVAVSGAAFIWAAAGDDSAAAEASTDASADASAEASAGASASADASADADADADAAQSDGRFKLAIKEFAMQPGSLTVVTGRVGCGKSSFLAALLGEMELDQESSEAPSVRINGSVSYCSQDVWIQNATLRDNVLFGREFDQGRYDAVIEACALQADIATLPAGDATEIGERGINLSGGQKARVSLARACYADADVVLLDDVLSAVDAHVARHITDKCLLGLLRQSGKAVLLATHQNLCFSDSDKLVLLEDGDVAFCGSYAEAKASPKFAELVGVSAIAGDAEAADTPESEAAAAEATAEAAAERQGVGNGEKEGGGKKDGSLIAAEEKKTGAVTWSTYTGYGRMVGNGMCLLIILLGIGLNVQSIILNWWLSRWSTQAGGHSLAYYLWVYFGLGVLACILILAFRILAAHGGLKAAAGIHGRMLKALLGAPLSFFDTTLSGRLLNLFTADMKAIDETLSSQMSGSLSLLFMMLSVVVMVVTVLPLSLVALVPLFVFYGWIQNVYRNTARELKRFDSTTQSPIFNHFAETLAGLSTIRAFRCEARMMEDTRSRVDYNTRFVSSHTQAQLPWRSCLGAAASSAFATTRYAHLTNHPTPPLPRAARAPPLRAVDQEQLRQPLARSAPRLDRCWPRRLHGAGVRACDPPRQGRGRGHAGPRPRGPRAFLHLHAHRPAQLGRAAVLGGGAGTRRGGAHAPALPVPAGGHGAAARRRGRRLAGAGRAQADECLRALPCRPRPRDQRHQPDHPRPHESRRLWPHGQRQDHARQAAVPLSRA